MSNPRGKRALLTAKGTEPTDAIEKARLPRCGLSYRVWLWELLGRADFGQFLLEPVDLSGPFIEVFLSLRLDSISRLAQSLVAVPLGDVPQPVCLVSAMIQFPLFVPALAANGPLGAGLTRRLRTGGLISHAL